MFDILLSPPVLFAIVLATVLLMSLALRRLSFKNPDRSTDMEKPYACGEEMHQQYFQPDYSQFFPFAFFFTILHVVVLFTSLLPSIDIRNLPIAVIYIAGGVVGLFILYKGD